MNIEDIIKNIVIQTLSVMNKRIVLFITGGKANEGEIFNILHSYKLVQYSIFMTEASKKVVSREHIDKLNGKIIEDECVMEEEITKGDLVIVPFLTRNSLAKIATGISDNLVTLGLQRSIMKNKNIMAIRDSYHPQNHINISKGYSKNQYYNNMLINYENVLLNMGIRVLNSSDLKGELDRLLTMEKKQEEGKLFKGRFLTLEDISNNLTERTFYLKRNVIITDHAKDFIEEKKITLMYVD